MLSVNTVPKVKKTEKCKIYLENGISLIDGISSWWTACHGYNNKYIKKKVSTQLDRMPHIMFGGLVHNQAIKLSQRIIKLLNNKLERVFFSDSGSIAVEVALKVSLQYWLNKGFEGKNKFVYFKNGYHGDTSATMSICDPDEGMHKLFNKFLNKNYMLNVPTTYKEKEKFTNFIKKNKNKIAAVIIEPLVQGAGGMKFHSSTDLEFIYKVTKKYKTLLIYDEIATGFYRTGSMFAFQQTSTEPDILCIGKALTGGTMTLAATICKSKVFEAFLSKKKNKELMHGPTYMANPLACSAANASLDLFEKINYKIKVNKIENILISQLHKYKHFNFVKDIRVKGAIGVIELFELNEKKLIWLRKEFLNNKVWIRPLRNVIYFMPPLIIGKDLNHLLKATYEILLKWKKQNEN